MQLFSSGNKKVTTKQNLIPY